MQETSIEAVETKKQPTKRQFFKRRRVWLILLCLVAVAAFAVWKKQQTTAWLLRTSPAIKRRPSLHRYLWRLPARVT